MVPADSCRISRVPHYSGAVSLAQSIFGYRPFTFCGGVFQHLLLIFARRFVDGPSTPADASPHRRFGLLRVRSPLLAQSLLFSLPPGTEMFQFPGFAPSMGWYLLNAGGLPHSEIRASRDICSCARLIAACHVLLRLREPRHPSCALFSFPFSLFGKSPLCPFVNLSVRRSRIVSSACRRLRSCVRLSSLVDVFLFFLICS